MTGDVVVYSRVVPDPPGVGGKLLGGVVPKPLLPVSMRIGGVDAEVSYMGGAPGFISGLMQVQAPIPDAVARWAPIEINIGGATSQPGLSVSVR